MRPRHPMKMAASVSISAPAKATDGRYRYGAGTRRHSGISDGDRSTQNRAKATFSSVTTAAGVLMIGGAGYIRSVRHQCRFGHRGKHTTCRPA
jgi:hypothetical protein